MIGGEFLDVDIAPDGEFLVVSYYDSPYFMAKVYDMDATDDDFVDFFESTSPVDTITVVQNTNYYARKASVAMGAKDDLYHSIAYSVPALRTVYFYRQIAGPDWVDTYGEGPTAIPVLEFTAPVVDIDCDDGLDHLVVYSEGGLVCKWYTLSMNAVSTWKANFTFHGNSGPDGAINGFSWVTVGVEEYAGEDHVVAIAMGKFDHYTEAFYNWAP